MKILSKIWEWLAIFFLGIISGIIVFIKFLDQPENVYQNEIKVRKIKNKNSDGNATSIDLNVDDNNDKNKEKRFRLKNLFNKNK